MRVITVALWSLSQINLQLLFDFLLKLAIFGAVLVLTWIATKIIGSLISKAVNKLSKNVARQTRRLTTGIIWFIGILIGLDLLGLNLTILILIISIGGLMVIIAIRDILLNVASHEIISTYTPFKIGDWIQVDAYFGRVVDIDWINTTLITLDNEIVYIPNSKITKSTIINRTTPEGTRISVPLKIESKLDFSSVEKALLELGKELADELAPNSKPEVRITSISGEYVLIEFLLMINNPAKRKIIISEILKKVKDKLDKNIEK